MNKKLVAGYLSRFASLLILFMMVLVFSLVVVGTSGEIKKNVVYKNIKIQLNDTEITLKNDGGKAVEPFIMDGILYVPAVQLSETLGASVSWDDKKNILSLTYDEDSLYEIIDADIPLANWADLKSAQKLYNMAKSFFDLCNKEREKLKLKPFVWDDKLYAVAQVRAKESLKLYEHKRPDGSKITTAFDEQKIKYLKIGENLGMEYKTVEGMLSGMMNSPTHKANIVGDFTKMAIAIVECPEDSGKQGYAFAQMFLTDY